MSIAIKLVPNTFRAAFWGALTAKPATYITAPGRVGRGDDPDYASKRLNLKLARVGGTHEVRVSKSADGKPVYGLFEVKAPKDAGVRAPHLSPSAIRRTPNPAAKVEAKVAPKATPATAGAKA